MKQIAILVSFLFTFLNAFTQHLPDKIFVTSFSFESGQGQYKRGGSDMYFKVLKNQLEISFENNEVRSANLFSLDETAKRKGNRKKGKVLSRDLNKKEITLENPEAAFILATRLLNKSYKTYNDTVRFTRQGKSIEIIKSDTSDRSGMSIVNFGIPTHDSLINGVQKAFDTFYLFEEDEYSMFPLNNAPAFIIKVDDINTIVNIYSRPDSVKLFLTHLMANRHNSISSFDIDKSFMLAIVDGSDTVSFLTSFPARFSVNWRKNHSEITVFDPRIHSLLGQFLPKDFLMYKQITDDGRPEYFFNHYAQWISRRKWVKEFIQSQRNKN